MIRTEPAPDTAPDTAPDAAPDTPPETARAANRNAAADAAPDPAPHAAPCPAPDAAPGIGFHDFLRVDIRVGRIVEALAFPEARRPAYRLRVDFGPGLGIRRSSAQITRHYAPDELVGRRILAVVNFPPRQIGPVRSEVLVLGVPDAEGEVVLVTPDLDVPLGGRLF